MKIIRTQGHILQSALPQETVAANMTRRLLKIIREEFDLLQAKVRELERNVVAQTLCYPWII